MRECKRGDSIGSSELGFGLAIGIGSEIGDDGLESDQRSLESNCQNVVVNQVC